jgi:hypothetical protein
VKLRSRALEKGRVFGLDRRETRRREACYTVELDMRLLRFLLLSVLAGCSTLAGCSYTHHQGVQANGASSQLYFSGAGGSSSSGDLLAVGYAAKVVVQRHSAGDVPCNGLGLHKNDVTSDGLRIQGGSIPDPDHCGSLAADAVTLVSAACADDTCSVTADVSDPRAVTLTVTGLHAGASSLLVSLKSSDGNTYADSVPLRFSAPARIQLSADARETAAMNTPVLPGVAFTKPTASVIDADGHRLVIDESAIQATSDGDAFVASAEYPPFVADHAGHCVLHWSYPGVPDRSLDLEVVDPSEAHALFVYAPLTDASTGYRGFVDPESAPPAGEPASGRITSIEVVAYDYGTFPIRVKLADGRFALAKLDAPVLAPAALGSALAALELSGFSLEGGKTPGQGTVTLRAAPGATATLAVKVTARPAR